MLSGVAGDEEIAGLRNRFSSGELIRMMTLLQETMSGFTRASSRRLDAELCILNLCQPELSLDAESLNARLTRLEDQIKTGQFVAAVPGKQEKKPVPEDLDDERPPMPGDEDVPPSEEAPAPKPASNTQAPPGFWTDLMTASRKELKPPASGFFVAAQNSPLRGALKGDTLELRCLNAFVADAVNRSDILEVVTRKASAMLGRPIRVTVVDMSAKPAGNPHMEKLIHFGKNHSEVVKIKE
jgi:DNA polymerase-3 subunit gamma/tau